MMAIESLHQALQNRIIPNQEYLLQGSIIESAVDHLLHRLRGLCDNVETSPETFHDLEVCMSMRQQNAQVPINLRVRRALDRDMPFQLRYIGHPEIDRSRPTLVRSSLDVGCTSTVLEFLTELGCRLEYEYISQGYMFRKGRMKITVAKIFKIIPGKPHDSEPVCQSYLVELSVVAPNGQDSIGDEMRAFAEQLKPLVQLEKIDYKRLG
uniref:Mediator of RNA polymerase II transcription subunit 18 n=1 Tax=Glossina palpalis gambiensis TaxID=67801 RepID=A0A1B0ASX0_9MUSC